MSCAAVNSSEPTVPTTETRVRHHANPLMDLIKKVAETVRGVVFFSSSNCYLHACKYTVKHEETKEGIPAEIERLQAELYALDKNDKEFNSKRGKLENAIYELQSQIEPKYRIQVPVRIASQESVETCKAQHRPNGKMCKNYGWQGTWSDAPPAGMENLPSELPIEFFIKKDGSFVEHGDKIEFDFEGKHVELTVCHQDELCIDRVPSTSFSKHLERMIQISESCNFIMSGAVNWIQDQIRKGEPMPMRSQYVWSKTVERD